MVTKTDIFTLLNKFDIKSDDTVLVHSSMRSIGGVDGGCDCIIDAFKEYLYDGLFVVPSHTWDRVNTSNPVFDVRKTMPCTGALSCVAVGRKDGVRSLHPTHSVVAFGRKAEEFVKGEENSHTPTPPGGCWARLYDENAKILLIGVGHNRNTYIHAVDEMIDLPNRLSENSFEVSVIDYDGNKTATFLKHHDFPGSEFFTNFKKPLETHGAVTYGMLGNALVYCCDAVKLTRVIKRMWELADYDFCEYEHDIPAKYYNF